VESERGAHGENGHPTQPERAGSGHPIPGRDVSPIVSDQTNEQPLAHRKSGIAIPQEITQLRASSVSIAVFERM